MIHLVRVHAAYVRGVGRKNNKDARCGSTQTFAAYNFYTYDEIIWRSINSEKVTPKKKQSTGYDRIHMSVSVFLTATRRVLERRRARAAIF